MDPNSLDDMYSQAKQDALFRDREARRKEDMERAYQKWQEKNANWAADDQPFDSENLRSSSDLGEFIEYPDPNAGAKARNIFTKRNETSCSTGKCKPEIVNINSMAEEYDRNKKVMLEISLNDRTLKFCLVEPHRIFREGKE